MAKAVTQKSSELIIDVEFTPDSGVYTSVCGMVDATVTRTSNVDTQEVPDCDDEDAPMAIEREVRSQEVVISGTGVWAQSSHGDMLDWWYDGTTRNVRVRNTKAATGDTEVESGPALLASLTNTRTRGQKVSAEIEIQFDGLPTRTDKS